MSITGHIYNRLSAYTGLTALVGLRIYPVVAPDSPEYPLVTYTLIAPNKAMSGNGTTGNGTNASYQFSAWGSTYTSARAVAAQLVAALEDYSGTSDSTTIQHSFYDSENESFEPTTKKYAVMIDFQIWYT